MLWDAIADSVSEGIVLLNRDMLVEGINQQARTLLHVTDSAIGHPLASSGVDYRVVRFAAAALAIHGEMSESPIADLQRRRSLVLRATHTRDGLVLIVRDETRLRHLETVRRDFVANISHELRTPVSAIHLIVETLQAGALDDRTAAEEFVRRIGLEVAHLARLVEELLELSRLEVGETALQRQPVQVARLIASLDRLAPLIQERHQRLEVDVAPGTPAIDCDPDRIEHVLRNLVHNAIRFSQEGGVINVDARSEGAQMVAISIRDHGVGIAPEDLTRVFERFWKADRSRMRDGEGTGLGLAIARHIIEAHGGRIDVDSMPGQGATFTMVLPSAA